MLLGKKTLFAFALAAAASVVAGTNAKAAIGDFTVNSTTFTPTGTTNTNSSIALTGVTVAQNAHAPTFISTGSITETDLSTSTNYTDHYSTNYTVTINFTDNNNGMTGSVTFAGTLAGDISDTNGTFSSTLNNTYTGGLTQTATLGTDTWTFTVSNTAPGFFTAPGPPGAADGTGTAGTFSSFVTVTAVPEPASMTLLGMGCLGALRVFRRRRAA